MKTKSEIDNLADAALNSIDNLQEVDANPFLYGKIQSRFAAIKLQHNLNIKIMSRLSIALLLFIGLNAGSYYLLNRQQKTEKEATAAQAIASEYNLKTGGYDY
jgi:hypothetical protein